MRSIQKQGDFYFLIKERTHQFFKREIPIKIGIRVDKTDGEVALSENSRDKATQRCIFPMRKTIVTLKKNESNNFF